MKVNTLLVLFFAGLSHAHINNTSDWSYFMLVQRWPLSTCQIVNASGHPCQIPTLVKGWTIHGLWPSGIKSYPSFCHQWKFDVKQVQDIEYDLLRVWPNLYVNEAVDSLWKHEYEKHGTCAASVAGFHKEHDYFKRTLEMLDKYDVQKLLEKGHIFPRRDGFEMNEIIKPIQDGYSKIVCPGCGDVKGIGQVLSQTYVCIDRKSLQQIDCPSCEKACDESRPILYQQLHS